MSDPRSRSRSPGTPVRDEPMRSPRLERFLQEARAQSSAGGHQQTSPSPMRSRSRGPGTPVRDEGTLFQDQSPYGRPSAPRQQQAVSPSSSFDSRLDRFLQEARAKSSTGGHQQTLPHRPDPIPHYTLWRIPPPEPIVRYRRDGTLEVRSLAAIERRSRIRRDKWARRKENKQYDWRIEPRDPSGLDPYGTDPSGISERQQRRDSPSPFRTDRGSRRSDGSRERSESPVIPSYRRDPPGPDPYGAGSSQRQEQRQSPYRSERESSMSSSRPSTPIRPRRSIHSGTRSPFEGQTSPYGRPSAPWQQQAGSPSSSFESRLERFIQEARAQSSTGGHHQTSPHRPEPVPPYSPQQRRQRWPRGNRSLEARQRRNRKATDKWLRRKGLYPYEKSQEPRDPSPDRRR